MVVHLSFHRKPLFLKMLLSLFVNIFFIFLSKRAWELRRKSYVDSEGNYNTKQHADHANRIRKFFNWLTKEIGCDVNLSPHRFRHAYGMRAINHYRLPITVVARMLGDTEQTIRENYCDLVTTTVMSMYNEAMSLFDQKKNPSKGGKRDAIGNK